MRKVIGGKVYDTEKARVVCKGEKENQLIYQKKTGEYFTYCVDANGRERIDPVSREWARFFAEHLVGSEKARIMFDRYNPKRTFADHVKYNVSLPITLDEKVRRIAHAKGVSLTEMLRRMVEAYPEE